MIPTIKACATSLQQIDSPKGEEIIEV